MANRSLLTIFFIGFSALALVQASAQDTWVGGNGNWSRTSNWSLGRLPTSSDNCVIPGSSSPTDDAAGICLNFSMASGDSLTIGTPSATTAYLYVYGTNLTNSGSITLTQLSGLHIAGTTGNTVNLNGGGTITLTTASNTISNSQQGETVLLNTDNTIQGQGGIGQGGMDIINKKTITASGGALTVQSGSNGVTNSGLMQAATGSTLNLVAGFLTVPFNNTGGTIQALTGSTVSLAGYTYTGGTFTTSGTGVFQIVPANNVILNNLTNAGTYQLVNGANTTWQGTMTNTGTFQALAGGLLIDGTVTLKGAGSVTGATGPLIGSFCCNPANLINQQMIQGGGTIGDSSLTLTNQGTINANNSTHTLAISGAPTNNTALMEATNGGTLEITNTVNNTGGTIEAQAGSTVLLSNGTVSGGTLTTSGTGSFQTLSGTLDGTVKVPTNAGMFIIANDNDLTLKGTVHNTGTIAMQKTGGCVLIGAPTTLTGSGKVTMTSTNCFSGSGNAFTTYNTIMGAGSIGDSNPMGITNNGTILANQLTPLTIVPDATGFTNNGKLMINKGSVLNINGKFNNFTGTTLSGGMYTVTGTLEVQNVSVVNNASNITLTGAAAEILDTVSGNNALKNLASNATQGVLSLQGGQLLSTGTSLTNAGKITVGASSALDVAGSYTQTAGTTTVDGTLSAPGGLSLQKGTLVGKGTIAAVVTSAAVITAGDSSTKPAKLTVTGSYTQDSTGTLNISIGGAAAGQFGEVAVSNGVRLGGTLAVKRINSFVPAIGESFTIVSGSAVSGTFTTVSGLSINSGEHFQVEYTSTAVKLVVVSGP